MKKTILLLIFAIVGSAAFAQEAADTTELTLYDYGYDDPHEWGYGHRYGIYNAWDDGCFNWQLHKGLNVSAGVSVFATSGRHGGAGFGENLNVMYAGRVNDKLTYAVGGYVRNINWRGSHYNEAGLTAMLNYRFNDRWEAFMYAHKNMDGNNNSMQANYYRNLYRAGDLIGAGVRYYFAPESYLQIAVEAERRDWRPAKIGTIDKDYLIRH